MTELVKSKGLNINESTSKGTALHIAVKLNFIDGIKMLLKDGGADRKAVDDKGRTCIDVCHSQ